MGKFKIGDKVIVRTNGRIGVIKGRDVHDLKNGRVAIEYIVKTDEGFQNWNTYGKKELAKLNNKPKQKKNNTLVVDAANGYKVTLVAIISKENVWKSHFDENGYYAPFCRKGKTLSIGYSICNPNDEFDANIGIKIATHRAKTSPFCHMTSDFNGEFNKETIDAILKVKGDYIINNIDKFTLKNDKI